MSPLFFFGLRRAWILKGVRGHHLPYVKQATSVRNDMKLRKNEYCPIHHSRSCCGREQAQKERRFRPGVRRLEDPHHPRGYRELRSSSEMRKLLNRKIIEQGGKCAVCHEAFSDYSDIVPYADIGIRHGMPTSRICRPDRFFISECGHIVISKSA